MTMTDQEEVQEQEQIPLPTFSLRATPENRDLMRRVNLRVRDDPVFASLLAGLLGKPEVVPFAELKERVARLEAVVFDET